MLWKRNKCGLQIHLFLCSLFFHNKINNCKCIVLYIPIFKPENKKKHIKDTHFCHTPQLDKSFFFFSTVNTKLIPTDTKSVLLYSREGEHH